MHALVCLKAELVSPPIVEVDHTIPLYQKLYSVTLGMLSLLETPNQ